MEEELSQEMLKDAVNDFYSSVCSWGYLDVKRAVTIYLEVGKYAEDLSEDVLRFAEDTGTQLKDLDVVYIAYDTIMQEARSKIEEVLGFDFCNDGQGTDLYVYGNCMCSSYDNTQGFIDELTERLSQIEDVEERTDKIQELKDDKVTNWFLGEVGFDFDKV